MANLTIQYPNFHDDHHRSSLASPSSPCSTGCIFGSAHPNMTCEEASAYSSREHLNVPQGLSHVSSYHDLNDLPLSDLIAQHGTSSSAAWLDSSKYDIWRPSQPIPESDFKPVQGYIRTDPFIIAWGNPLVSSPVALEKTARAFIAFAEANHLHPIWSCVDTDLEAILAESALGWVTLSCIYEDFMDPAHVIEIMAPETVDHPRPKDQDNMHVSEELVRNLHKAEVLHMEVHEIGSTEWRVEEKRQVEVGITEWRARRHGMESMNLLPWVDEPHRRYWVAKHRGKIVGIEILTPTGPLSWQIVECIAFARSPKGTTEMLIHTALRDLQVEQEKANSAAPAIIEPDTSLSSPVDDRMKNRLRVSFGITAADHLKAGHNVSGWKVTVLSTTYHALSSIAGLVKSGQFRNKFHTTHEPMYVCYPANGHGLLAVGALLKALRS